MHLTQLEFDASVIATVILRVLYICEKKKKLK